MPALEFFANSMCCNIYLAICALFFIHLTAKLHPGKLIVSATLLRAIVFALTFVFCHPAVASRLPNSYYVFLFSLPLLPVVGALFLFPGRARFALAGLLMLVALCFLECVRILMCWWFLLLAVFDETVNNFPKKSHSMLKSFNRNGINANATKAKTIKLWI